VPLGALKLTWPVELLQSKLKYMLSPQFGPVLSG
jgi:hypothetical protein